MRNLARIVAAVVLAMISIAGIGSVASAAPPAGSISGTVYQAGGGLPVWAWILIGLGSLAVVGTLGQFAFMRPGKQQ